MPSKTQLVSALFHEKEKFPAPVKLRGKNELFLDAVEDLISEQCRFCPDILDWTIELLSVLRKVFPSYER